MPEGIFATIYGESVTMWGFLAASATALVLGIAYLSRRYVEPVSGLLEQGIQKAAAGRKAERS